MDASFAAFIPKKSISVTWALVALQDYSQEGPHTPQLCYL